MIDNHLQRVYLVASFLLSVIITLIILLCFEYHSFCCHVKELVAVKEQYYLYVHMVQKNKDDNHEEENDTFIDEHDDYGDERASITLEELSIASAEVSDAPDDDDDYVDDSFVVINRQADYLQQSTVEYLQSHDLPTVLTSLDINQWSTNESKKNNVKVARKTPVATMQRQARVVQTRQPIKDYGLSWPIGKDKFWLSSLFGARKRIDGTWGFHHGIDMAATKGMAVKSARGGEVVEASFQTGYGNTVVVQHTPDLKTRYAHLNTICVRVGQVIPSGVAVGTVGETGFIRKKGKDGSHLHFEVYEKGKRINPLHCLPRSR
jgi:murein DD-endopeptidase MepM/ murein hydrolase activator NlpD